MTYTYSSLYGYNVACDLLEMGGWETSKNGTKMRIISVASNIDLVIIDVLVSIFQFEHSGI